MFSEELEGPWAGGHLIMAWPLRPGMGPPGRGAVGDTQGPRFPCREVRPAPCLPTSDPTMGAPTPAPSRPRPQSPQRGSLGGAWLSTPLPAHTPARERGLGGPRDRALRQRAPHGTPCKVLPVAGWEPGAEPLTPTDGSFQPGAECLHTGDHGCWARLCVWTAARGRTGTHVLASGRSPVSARLGLGLRLYVGSTAF